MSEFKKEIAVAVTIAVVIAAAIAVGSITSFSAPPRSSLSYSSVQSSTSSQISTSSSSQQLTSSSSTMRSQTLSSSNSSSSSSSNQSVQLYTLTFQQSGECSPPQYDLPWGITLETHGGNQTETAPPGLVLPTTLAGWNNYTCHCYSSGIEPTASQTDINFTVSSGVYTYAINAFPLFFARNGTATVNGTNTIIHVEGPGVTCYSGT